MRRVAVRDNDGSIPKFIDTGTTTVLNTDSWMKKYIGRAVVRFLPLILIEIVVIQGLQEQVWEWPLIATNVNIIYENIYFKVKPPVMRMSVSVVYGQVQLPALVPQVAVVVLLQTIIIDINVIQHLMQELKSNSSL